MKERTTKKSEPCQEGIPNGLSTHDTTASNLRNENNNFLSDMYSPLATKERSTGYSNHKVVKSELIPLTSTRSHHSLGDSIFCENNVTSSEDESECNQALKNTRKTDDIDEQNAISLDNALEKIGIGYFNYKLAIIGGIAILSSYLAIGAMAFIIPAGHCDLRLTPEGNGRLASASFLGLIVTCHLWGFLSDTLGRRYILVRCLFCDGLLYLITMLNTSTDVMFILRVLNGVASCGGIVSIYAYIGEFQPNIFRPHSIMIASLVASTAYFLLPLTAWLTIPAKWKFELYKGLIFKPWRLYYILCGIPSLVSSVLLMFMPESPKFLLAKGENEKVIEILKLMHYENNNESKFTITKISVNESEKVKKIAENENKAIAFLKLVWHQTVPLLKRPYVKNLTLISVSLFATFFCNNGIYIWLADSLNRLQLYKSDTGLEAGTYCQVAQYGHQIIKHISTNVTSFNDSGIEINGNMSAKWITEAPPTCIDKVDTKVYLIFSILGTCQFLSWIIMTVITKLCNKKYLIVTLTVGILLSLASLKISSSFSLLPFKITSLVICTGALFPVLNGIVVDLFPTNLRAMAGCLALMSSRLGTLSVNIISGMLIGNQCELFLWLMLGVIAVSVVTVLLLPVHADDKDQNSINNEVEQETSNAA